MAKSKKGKKRAKDEETLTQDQDKGKAIQMSTEASSGSPLLALNRALSLPSSSSSSPSLLDILTSPTKEALAEMERLRSQVAQLQKEIETKDAIIAKLQANAGEPIRSSLAGKTESSTVSRVTPTSSKPSPADTIVQTKQARDSALQCGICVDYFSSPFTAECGHTFCYECLHAWLEIHKSCPTCRAKLLRRPTLSFSIREQVMAVIARLPEAERKEAMAKIQEGEDYLQSKQRRGDPWESIFRPPDIRGSDRTILDQDDGVRRCVSCGWEVRGGSCVNCSTLYSEAEDSDNSQEDSDLESDADSYDSHDSFIDDDEVRAADGRTADPDYNDLYFSDRSILSDSDGDTGGRRRTRYRRQASRDSRAKMLSTRSKGPPLVFAISDDSESETGLSATSSVEHVSEAESSGPSRKRAGKASRVVLDSDLESSEDGIASGGKRGAKVSRVILDSESDSSEEESEEDKLVVRRKGDAKATRKV
ncbi:E3 ubiquitin ligase, partial [Mortierella sp. GBA43]